MLEGRPRTLWLPVDGTVREMMGLNAYMNRDALNRALGEGDLSGGFVLLLPALIFIFAVRKYLFAMWGIANR